MLHELTEPHGLEVERVGTGLGLAQLEQLIDHDAKVCDLGNQELDGCPQAFGELSAPPFDHVRCRCQRREGRTELVTHVRHEPGVAVDSRLQRAADPSIASWRSAAGIVFACADGPVPSHRPSRTIAAAEFGTSSRTLSAARGSLVANSESRTTRASTNA